MDQALQTTTSPAPNTEFAIVTFLKRSSDIYINSKKSKPPKFLQKYSLHFSVLGERMQNNFLVSTIYVNKGTSGKCSDSTEFNMMEM